jgi:hypothetical protein
VLPAALILLGLAFVRGYDLDEDAVATLHLDPEAAP